MRNFSDSIVRPSSPSLRRPVKRYVDARIRRLATE
jgi:hypothetical protein